MSLFNYLNYIHRPMLWPHFYRLFIKKIERFFHHDINSEDKIAMEQIRTKEYLEERAITLDVALKNLNNLYESQEFYKKHETILTEAKEKANVHKSKLGDLGGATNLSLIFFVSEMLQANNVVETGVAYGWSSLSILLSITNRPNSMLWSVDLPYLEIKNDNWVGSVVPKYMNPNWKLFKCADRDGLPRIFNKVKEIDLAHYDSDKTYEGRLYGYKKLWAHLRIGGALISDDIGDNMAFIHFCDLVKRDPTIIKDNNKFQGIIFK